MKKHQIHRVAWLVLRTPMIAAIALLRVGRLFLFSIFKRKTLRRLIMSLFDETAAIKAKLDALSNVTAPDLSTLATAAEVAELSAKLDTLAAAVGTPPAPVV